MAGKKDDQLLDKHVIKLAEQLSRMNMNILAVIEMGLKKIKLESIWQEKRPTVALYNAEVIRTWRNQTKNSSNSKQKFADILYNSDVIDAEDVKDILGVDKSDTAASTDASPNRSPRLTAKELGQLADEIAIDAMQAIAQSDLGAGAVKIKNKMYNNPEDAWWFNFEILVEWTNKSTENNRQKLKTILIDSQKVGKAVVDEILGEDLSAEPLEEREMEVTTTSSSEVDGLGASQDLQDTDHKQIASNMAPLSFGTEPTDSQTNGSLQPLDVFKRVKKFLSGTKFPDGRQLEQLPTKEKGVEYGFDWLSFYKIQKTTTDDNLGVKTTPVTIAVIDTGIYEDHERLHKQIIRDQSRCFVKGTKADQASLDDLTKDEWNHGTMVAGVIVLNGPEKVRIINLKAQPVKGVPSDMQPVVDALKHVKSLDGTENEVDIVNISVGQFKYQEGLEEIIDELAKTKILVSSAGNSAAHASNTVTFPAKLDKMIAVGACDSAGHTCDESSRGKEVEFLCPGEEVVSTTNMQNGRKYFVCNGTSFSSPHAAAVAAHVLVAMEAKKYRDAKNAKKSDKEAKQEGLDYRKKLRKNRVMRNVFRQMCDAPVVPGSAGVLHPYKNCFRNLELLYDYCNTAVDHGREDHVTS